MPGHMPHSRPRGPCPTPELGEGRQHWSVGKTRPTTPETAAFTGPGWGTPAPLVPCAGRGRVGWPTRMSATRAPARVKSPCAGGRPRGRSLTSVVAVRVSCLAVVPLGVIATPIGLLPTVIRALAPGHHQRSALRCPPAPGPGHEPERNRDGPTRHRWSGPSGRQ